LINCRDGFLFPRAATPNDIGKLVDFISRVEHGEGNPDAITLGRCPHLIMRKVIQPSVARQIQNVNVRSMIARAGPDDANALSVHMLNEPVAEVQHVFGDFFDDDAEHEVDRRAPRHTFIHTRYGVGYKLEAEPK